ncbi:hypothetical protein, partial [Rhodoferax sp.]|uniref:hypothetical protein n=1 Tax=Rhodoferax sp. TaxID=50421 RepID=UPI00374D2EF5
MQKTIAFMNKPGEMQPDLIFIFIKKACMSFSKSSYAVSSALLILLAGCGGGQNAPLGTPTSGNNV